MMQVMHRKIKICATAGLGVASLFLIPAVAHANTNGTVNLYANVEETGLELTLSNTTANLNLAPPYSGSATDTTSVSVQVATYNGYQLFMSADQNLVSSSDNTNTISTLSSSCASGCNIGTDNFTNNAWGFSVGNENTNFIGVPTNEEYTIGSYKGAEKTDSYTVNFGAKVNFEQAPGVYSGAINFIAISNPTKLYMQSMNDSRYCTKTPQTVWDSRDESSYTVQRLDDGNCWMLDNLALGSTATSYNLTSGDTNLPEGSSFTLPKSTSNKPSTGGEAWADSYIAAYINAEGNCINSDAPNQYPCRDENGNIVQGKAYTKNDPALKPSGYDIGANGNGKIGVYYNYCAASAGTYCYATNAPEVQDNAEIGRKNAEYDVCPKGWRLPAGSDSGEYRKLYMAYDGAATGNANNTKFKAALATPLSGDFWGGSAHYQGVYGLFWSSTWYSGTYMYNLAVSASEVNPANANNRYNGRSVRCMLAAE